MRGVVDGAEELLRLPTGCGEQNLIYLGPNVYTMRYLKAVGRLTSTVEKKARAFIRQGELIQDVVKILFYFFMRSLKNNLKKNVGHYRQSQYRVSERFYQCT